MGTEIRDYLTKQLFIDKNIVTFRSLSRQFKIHVNAAKNELADFHAHPDPSSGSVHATYLLTGELAPTGHTNGDSMDVDDDVQEGDDDGEDVPAMSVSLVGERDLERVRSAYARVFSLHVYCLSPAPVIDAGLVCTPSEKVYETDAKLRQDEAALLGRVIGPHVQKGKPVKFTAVPAKEPLARKATEPSFKSKEPAKKDEKKDEQKDDKTAEQKKLKPSGTLDWSKARAKGKPEEKKDEKPKEEAKVKEEKKDEPRLKAKPSLKPAASKSAVPAKPAPKPEPKRGTKRKSALTMDSTDDEADASSRPSTKPSSPADSSPAPSPPPPTQARAPQPVPKHKRMVIVSDDEDDVPPRAARGAKGKGRAKPVVDVDVEMLPSRKEKSLQAMMDIDDDHVERVPRRRAPPLPHSSDAEPSPRASPDPDTSAPEPEPSEPEDARDDDGDVDMDVDYGASLDARRRRARAPKKAVPLGRNGLPKRRVVKSVMVTREDGYFETKDVSEYESVDENDADAQPVPPPPKAKKPRAKKASPPAEQTVKAKAKPATDDTEDEVEIEIDERPAKALKAEKTQKAKEERKPGFRPGQAVKRAGSSKGSGQGSLMNFFGKK